MNRCPLLGVSIIVSLVLFAGPSSQVAAAASEWVYSDSSGKLVYKALPTGDRIMDFSSAGFKGGGVALPSVPVRKTVKPSGGDDTAAIQNAIDEVSKMEAVEGVRGAVLLEPGTFRSEGTLTINVSGVVLRGSGSGTQGTLLKMAGKQHVCITISGPAPAKPAGSPVPITDAYVPSGTSSFQVADASGFKVGETILIRKPVSDAWVKFMGMDTLVRDGKKERWVSGEIAAERTITIISGKKITVDVPLSDSYDSRYLSPPGASVVKRAPQEQVSLVGVENLRIESPAQAIGITEAQYNALRMRGSVVDSWVRDLVVLDTINSMSFGADVRRVTVEKVDIQHTVETKGAAKPADFGVDGCQILLNRCSGKGNSIFYVVTGGRVTGPNVLLNCVFHGNGHIQPHMRWATGLLVDNCQVPEAGIDMMNRGEMGTGHGWTMGWGVAWNCVAKTYVIQNPPGCVNWAIGCRGSLDKAAMPFGKSPMLPEGIYDSAGTRVEPPSLYLAQLRERLGTGAVRNIGY